MLVYNILAALQRLTGFGIWRLALRGKRTVRWRALWTRQTTMLRYERTEGSCAKFMRTRWVSKKRTVVH
jgi:hypothetical protein